MKRLLLLLFSVLTMIAASAHELKDYLVPTPRRVDIQADKGITYHPYQFQQMQNYFAQFNLATWEKDVTFHEYGENIVKVSLRVDPRFTPQGYELTIKGSSVGIAGGSK